MASRRLASREPRIEVISGPTSRRSFLRAMGGAAATASAMGLAPAAASAWGGAVLEDAKAKAVKPAESFVKELHDSLTESQRALVCMPFDHEKRSMVRNNWHIVDEKVASIGKLYTPDQQELIRQIFRGVTTPEGYERFQRQMKDDAGGFENYTCAIFGEPGDKFEWVLTGRHLTIRADGDSVEGAAFGGPIFYGHAVEADEKPDHPGNVWWHQARMANRVYQALDGKQRDKALVIGSPPDSERTVRFRDPEQFEGIRVGDLSADQKGLVKETLGGLLSMYRERDVKEVLSCLEKNHGLDALSMSFYQDGDLGEDGIWDRWRVEGPAFIWYFRGSPHVHTWVHVADGLRKAREGEKDKETSEV